MFPGAFMKKTPARKRKPTELRKSAPRIAQRPQHGRADGGRFAAGNTISLKHGGRSRRVALAQLPGQDALRASLRGMADGIAIDLGGVDELSTLKRELIKCFTETSAIRSYLGENILREGVLTTKGRTRAAVGTYLSVVDRLSRLAQAIGLARVPKQVQDLDAFLAQRAQQPQKDDNHA
jgi:hypothetical protein